MLVPLGMMALGMLNGKNPLQQFLGGTQQQQSQPSLWQQLTGQLQTSSPWQQHSPWNPGPQYWHQQQQNYWGQPYPPANPQYSWGNQTQNSFQPWGQTHELQAQNHHVLPHSPYSGNLPHVRPPRPNQQYF